MDRNTGQEEISSGLEFSSGEPRDVFVGLLAPGQRHCKISAGNAPARVFTWQATRQTIRVKTIRMDSDDGQIAKHDIPY